MRQWDRSRIPVIRRATCGIIQFNIIVVSIARRRLNASFQNSSNQRALPRELLESQVRNPFPRKVTTGANAPYPGVIAV